MEQHTDLTITIYFKTVCLISGYRYEVIHKDFVLIVKNQREWNINDICRPIFA